MSLQIWILAASLAIPAPLLAWSEWRRAALGGVQVYTDAGPGMAAQVLGETLSFYAACARGRGLEESPPALTVVYFAREPDFRRIRAEGFSRAFFQRSGEAGWVVVHRDPDALRWLRHELVHAMNDRAGWSFLPAWLNEGLAEYYSALDVGAAARGRVQVATIQALAMQVSSAGASFAENDLAAKRLVGDQGLFYARAWALVRHMVAERGAAGINRFAGMLRDGTPPEHAFASVYGAPMGEMIVRARQSAARLEPGGIWKRRAWPPPRGIVEQAVNASDADFVLGELARFGGVPTEAEKRHEAALIQAGLGPDRQSLMAMSELRKGNLDSALALMERAAGQGSRDALMWFDYAMLMRETGVSRPQWIGALRRAVELDPQRGEAWFVLGVSTEGDESVAALERAAQASPASPWVWEAYGRALLGAGRRGDARAAAREALRQARSPGDRSMAEGLLAALDAPASMPGPERPAVVTPGNWTSSPAQSRLEGRLVEVDCSAPSPVLIVESDGGGRTRVSVKRPGGVSVRGGGEFTCGRQPARRKVILGHDGQPDQALRAAGDVLSIEYQ